MVCRISDEGTAMHGVAALLAASIYNSTSRRAQIEMAENKTASPELDEDRCRAWRYEPRSNALA